MVTPNAGPVGWRFSPKDEELINYFLARKINGKEDDVRVIREIDVCKWEPWDLPGQSVLKSDDKEWFFFCPRDKITSSSRLNRGTQRGFWKATGKDRKIRSKKNEIGIKKSLVFHTGRAPKCQRTFWVMHEYRATSKELDGTHPGQRPFVLCRLFKKDDEFVSDATEIDLGVASPTLTPNEHPRTDSRPDPVSPQVRPLAGQEGEDKILSPESCKDESFKTPSQDLEDIINSTSVEPEIYFDYRELFADPDPNGMFLFDSPTLESMESSLPDESATNKFYATSDLQLDCDTNAYGGCSYEFLRSLPTNYPGNIFEDHGDELISVADYENPQNEHLNLYQIPSLDDGSFPETNADEAELSKMVAGLQQYAFTPESNDLDKSRIMEMQAGLEHCVFSGVIEPSGYASLSTSSGIQIRDRQPQAAPAISNFNNPGKAQRRILLQKNLRRRLLPESEPIHTSEHTDGNDKTPTVYILQASNSGLSKKGISSSSFTLQPPQLPIPYKLFLGAASAVLLIFAAYAGIRGCLSRNYCSWLS